MVKEVKQYLTRAFNNSRGWSTKRKIVVIESDDWGSIRMFSKDSYRNLLSKGIRVDKCPYSKYDCLENSDDLICLFEVLASVKDLNGRHPVITANTNVVNPDFEGIRKTNFEQYEYDNIVDCYQKYQGNTGTMATINQGIQTGLYFPQYHGREHVNVNLWMELLRRKGHIMQAFDQNVFGLGFATSREIEVPYLATFIYRNENEFESVQRAIVDGAEIFSFIFGFKPSSIIAPLYSWTSDLEVCFNRIGIRYIQGLSVRKEYNYRTSNWKKRRRFCATGVSNSVNLIRNARFEPSLVPSGDEVSYCLRDVHNAFAYNKPAVISAHRVNFIGQLHPSNRDVNLKRLHKLFHSIVKRWPTVEFMSSVDLGELIRKDIDGEA